MLSIQPEKKGCNGEYYRRCIHDDVALDIVNGSHARLTCEAQSNGRCNSYRYIASACGPLEHCQVINDSVI